MVITVFLSGTDIELMFDGDYITTEHVINKLVNDDIIGLWCRHDYLSPNPYTYGRFCNEEGREEIVVSRDMLRQELKNHIMLSKIDRYHILSANDMICHEDRLYGICTL